MFKSWPYWVRGGVTASVIALIYYICWITFLFNLLPYDGRNYLFIGLLAPFVAMQPFCSLEQLIGVLGYIGYCKYLPEFYFPSLLNMIIYYFIVGSIFGWLYGKIRNRKEGQGSQDNFQ